MSAAILAVVISAVIIYCVVGAFVVAEISDRFQIGNPDKGAETIQAIVLWPALLVVVAIKARTKGKTR